MNFVRPVINDSEMDVNLDDEEKIRRIKELEAARLELISNEENYSTESLAYISVIAPNTLSIPIGI